MSEFWQYQFQSGITLTLLFGVYWFLLRKETFFRLHRFFLLAAGIISLVLPLINFSILIGAKSFSPVQIVNSGYHYVETAVVINPVRITEGQQGGFNVYHFIWGVYLTGVFLLIVRLVYQVIKIAISIRQSETRILRNLPVNVNHRIPAPFSFFGQIFIPFGVLKYKHFEEILIHEAEHIKQKHSWDLLFMELLCVFQWFNPIVWMVGRTVRETHEFLADQAVLAQGTIRTSYQSIILEHALGVPVFGLSHYFNNTISKKRIIMMKKSKSPNRRKLRMLFLIPLLVFLSMAFSNPFSGGKTFKDIKGLTETHLVKGKVLDDSTGEPLPGTHVIIFRNTIGTVSDSNGEFSLEVDNEETSLAVSYVGYKTVIVEVKDREYLEIRLKRDVYKLNLEQPKLKDFTDHGKSDSPVEKSQDEVNVIVEDVPHFPGGNQALQEYLAANIKYPENAKEEGISGTVWVKFTVDESGIVKNVMLDKKLYPPLDKEALHVISSMPEWEPGYQHGKAVPVELVLPVMFIYIKSSEFPAQDILK